MGLKMVGVRIRDQVRFPYKEERFDCNCICFFFLNKKGKRKQHELQPAIRQKRTGQGDQTFHIFLHTLLKQKYHSLLALIKNVVIKKLNKYKNKRQF